MGALFKALAVLEWSVCDELSLWCEVTDFWCGNCPQWRRIENVEMVSVTLTYKIRSKC